MRLSQLRSVLASVAIVVALSACQPPSATVPAPVVMTDDALGHYCQMYLSDHGGPKAQIHLKGIEAPIWFAQISDAVAFLHDPERPADVAAIYVNDMAKARSWSDVGIGNWIPAEDAFYVINSKQMGGMGTREAIPYSTREAGEAFARQEGGVVVAIADIPDAYVRAAAEPDTDETQGQQSGAEHDHVTLN